MALVGYSSSLAPLIDIAVNLTDCVFVGVDWKGKQVHPNDFKHMMLRAERSNVQKCLISGTSLVQCARAIKLCRLYPGKLYCTVGIHPANSTEFLVPISDAERQYVESVITATAKREGNTHTAKTTDESSEGPVVPSRSSASILDYTTGTPLKYSEISEEHRAQWQASKSSFFEEERLHYLALLVRSNRDVVASLGECGLDGAELEYCPYEIQERYFRRQVELAERLMLPLFLHSRDCGMRFVETLGPLWDSKALNGVVHSFTGDDEELDALLSMGLCIGLNGSAFRTEESAKRSILKIPVDRLMLETDAPWCDIRKDNFSFQFVKTNFPTVKKEKLKTDLLSKENTAPCVERRNEPCHLLNVLECYVGCNTLFSGAEVCRNINDLSNQVYVNTVKVFPLLA